jgi:hypothetical protein
MRIAGGAQSEQRLLLSGFHSLLTDRRPHRDCRHKTYQPGASQPLSEEG